MLFDEAAAQMVRVYRETGLARINGFEQIVAVLCYLYPAAPRAVVAQEVVRNFSTVARRLH